MKGHLVKKQTKKSGFAHIMVITVVVTVGLVGALGFLFWQNFIQPKSTSSSSNKSVSNTKNVPTTSPQSQNPTANWKTYSGNGISFKYPQDWHTSTSGDSEITTITFGNQVYDSNWDETPKSYRGGYIMLEKYGRVYMITENSSKVVSRSNSLESQLPELTGMSDSSVATRSRQIGVNKAVCLENSQGTARECGIKASLGIYTFPYLTQRQMTDDADLEKVNQIYESAIFS